MTEPFPTPESIEYRVIEIRPGLFAPVVARGGEWVWQGGRVFGSPERAEDAAPQTVNELRSFWWGQWARPDRRVIAGGVHYRLGGRGPDVKPEVRGSGGGTFLLRDLTTGDVTETCDLWSQGTVPDFARPWLPDTHEFIERSTP